MGCRLYGEKETIEMCYLKYGQVAVVVEQDVERDERGNIVIKTNSGFRTIGVSSSSSWWHSDCTIKVRVLNPGELIEIT